MPKRYRRVSLFLWKRHWMVWRTWCTWPLQPLTAVQPTSVSISVKGQIRTWRQWTYRTVSLPPRDYFRPRLREAVLPCVNARPVISRLWPCTARITHLMRSFLTIIWKLISNLVWHVLRVWVRSMWWERTIRCVSGSIRERWHVTVWFRTTLQKYSMNRTLKLRPVHWGQSRKIHSSTCSNTVAVMNLNRIMRIWSSNRFPVAKSWSWRMWPLSSWDRVPIPISVRWTVIRVLTVWLPRLQARMRTRLSRKLIRWWKISGKLFPKVWK